MVIQWNVKCNLWLLTDFNQNLNLISGWTLLHQPRSLRRLQELQDIGRLPCRPQPALRQGDADRHLRPAVSLVGLWRRRRWSSEGERRGSWGPGERRLRERERPARSPEGVGSSAALPHAGRDWRLWCCSSLLVRQIWQHCHPLMLEVLLMVELDLDFFICGSWKTGLWTSEG